MSGEHEAAAPVPLRGVPQGDLQLWEETARHLRQQQQQSPETATAAAAHEGGKIKWLRAGAATAEAEDVPAPDKQRKALLQEKRAKNEAVEESVQF